MSLLRVAGLLLAVTASAALLAETPDEYFKVFTDAPRIFLRPQRLRMLKRERERQSERWEQFATVASGMDALPEPGLVNALYACVADDKTYARRAIDWASAPGSDARQVALVLDWRRSEMTAQERAAIVQRLRKVALEADSDSLPAVRTRVFAAIAIASDDPGVSESVLRDVVTGWWRKRTVPSLSSGKLMLSAADNQALYELLHVIRDNLNIDLREDIRQFFKEFAEWQILSHLPPPYEGLDNDYYIPAHAGSGDPDLRLAALSRIAGLSMVAYDDNSRDSQFLQGWLMQDNFSLMGGFGASYEFLWANPYLPGLSYRHMPELFYDAASGRLALRSSWDEDAAWLGDASGEFQLFSSGHVEALKRGIRREPMTLGSFRVFFGQLPTPLSLKADEFKAVVLLGAAPESAFSVQAGAEHSYNAVADKNGTVVLEMPAGAAVVIKAGRSRKSSS